MTFQSLSALTLGPGATSVAKSQESGGARPERTGPAGRDFSAFLSQAMLSKDWTGANGLPRQGLADLGTQALDPGSQDPSSPNAASAAVAAPPNPRDASATGVSRDSTRTPSTTTVTNQELTQRALRTASLRTAQSRADGTSHGRPALSDTRGRKAISRRDDEPHGNASAGNPMAVPPSVPHRPLESTQAVSGTDTSVAADKADAALADATPVTQAQPALLSPTPCDNPSGATPAPGSDGLTTLQLSPQMQIITSGQGVVNEQSLQAFAQSMGIDANQFKQLVTAAPAGSMDTSGLRAGVTATDALTGTPILTAAPTDVTTIDLSQVLPAGMPLEDLHIELMGNRRGPSVDAGSLSTLEVLGMREGANGAEGITSAQASADTGASGQQPDNSSMGQSSVGASARATATSANTAAAPAAQNMAEHFEKLSAKLATEMAGRIHEQFSQGEWKMKFALKPASLGQVDVQLEMRDGKLAAVLQADNPMTQDLLQNGSQRLRDALSQMGLSQSSVLVGDGRSQSFQGDRHPGAQGMASAPAHHQDSLDESVQSVASAPRRDSLSQLDFYA